MAADGSIVIKAEVDAKSAQKELNSLEKKIEQTEESISDMQRKREEASQKSIFSAAELDAEKAKLQEIKDRLRDIQILSKDKSLGTAQRSEYANLIPGVKEELAEQQTRVRMLQTEYNKIANSVDRYDQKLSDANASLDRQKERAGELVQQLTAAWDGSNLMDEALQRVEKSSARFASRMREIISGALFFNLISSGMSKLVQWTGKVIQTNAEATAAIARLKGALLTLAQPILNVIIPAFVTLVNILSKVVSVIAQVISMLFGTTAKSSAEAAENLYNETDALNSVGAAAEEAAGSLAGFDEINQLSSNDGVGGARGASSSDILPDLSEAGDLSWLSETLGDAAGWVTAALLLGGIALVAIGACTGNLVAVIAGLLLIGTSVVIGTETGVLQSWVDTLGLNSVSEFVVLAILLGGIAIVAIGAATGNILAVIAGLALIGATILYTEQSGLIESWTEEQLSKAASYITAALLLGGIALVAIGAATGNILMVIAGLGLLAAGVFVGVESGTLKAWADVLGLDSVFDYVVAGIQLAGIALIAIGAMMGNIVMVIAGAVILAAGVTADVIGEETLSNWWDVLKLTSIQQWVSVALLLGGIALIAIGAAMGNVLMILAGFVILSVSTITAASEGNLKDWVTTLGLEKAAGWVTAGLLIGGIALVVFGILTANILMVIAGLGLLGAGISVGVTSGTFSSWLNTIADAFVSFKNRVVDTFNELRDRLKSIINAILSAIEWMANKVTDGINFVIGALNNLSFKIPDWVPELGGKKFGFNIQKLKPVHIPRLAAGAVIPPNREFLAVLGDQSSGTNVEAPLSTIEQALENVLARSSGMNSGPIEVKLVVDSKTLARVVVPQINNMTRQAGKPVLLY